jgi:Flp pilus assembly protein TadG
MRRGRRGSQAVEFALSVPFMLAIVSTVVDLSEFLNRKDALVASVAAGARAGAVVEKYQHLDPREVAVATALTSWDVSGASGTPTLRASYVGTKPDRLVEVSGTVPFEPLFGFLPLPETIGYTGAVLMVIQE